MNVLGNGSDWPCCVILLVIAALVYAPYLLEDVRKQRGAREAKERAERIAAEAAAREKVNATPPTRLEVNSTFIELCADLEFACQQFRLAAVRRHPLVKFSDVDVDSMIDADAARKRLAASRSDSLQRTAAEIAVEAQSRYRQVLGEDFKDHSCALTVREIAAGSHGPDDFWETEERHRNTTRGTKADDWSLRRQAVHARDHGICLRCGVRVSVEECHIHHTVKSKHGGTNELENLATLCRDCHCMMPAHEHMRVGTLYAIFDEQIHRRNCACLPQHDVPVKRSVWNRRSQRWGKRKRTVWVERADLDGLDSHPYNIAIERGYAPCEVCRPGEQFRDALERWLPSVLRP